MKEIFRVCFTSHLVYRYGITKDANSNNIPSQVSIAVLPISYITSSVSKCGGHLLQLISNIINFGLGKVSSYFKSLPVQIATGV